MGRGGPPEPEVAEVAPTLEALLELSRSGRHAASDYLETAALAGVDDDRLPALRRRARRRRRRSRTCTRARGWPPSSGPTSSLFDGSGAAIPPVETGRRILVVNAQQPTGGRRPAT